VLIFEKPPSAFASQLTIPLSVACRPKTVVGEFNLPSSEKWCCPGGDSAAPGIYF